MSTLTFHSRDINCRRCAGTVWEAVRARPGVSTFSIDLTKKSADVLYAAPAVG